MRYASKTVPNMYWFPIALLAAFSLSSADALSKKALVKTDDIVIAWVREGYALPFLALGFLFVDIPALDLTFYIVVLVLLPLEITALMLYVKAIKLSPLSLTIPFMALSPVFILFIAFATLGEKPSAAGLAGVLLIAAGAYLLNASASRFGLLAPLQAIRREPGSMLMIAVALIYSVTATLGKVAVQHSNPLFFGFFYPFVLTIILTFIVLRKGKLGLVASRPWTFLPIGLCTAVMVVSHFVALNMTQVVYMISVKRTSLIFSVFYGGLLFKELHIRERLLGAVVMLAGVVFITLF